MQRSVVLNIVGLTDRLIGEYTPNISSFCQERSKYSVKPVFPALTCAAQSIYLTGKDVKDHGIVANGWYSRDLAEHQFWKQSNHLVKGPKVWDILRGGKFSVYMRKSFLVVQYVFNRRLFHNTSSDISL